MQVPLRKTNINGGGLRNAVGIGVGSRGIPPIPDEHTKFAGIGSSTNVITGMNTSYPQHHHLMTTMTRNNGADGFTTTANTG